MYVEKEGRKESARESLFTLYLLSATSRFAVTRYHLRDARARSRGIVVPRTSMSIAKEGGRKRRRVATGGGNDARKVELMRGVSRETAVYLVYARGGTGPWDTRTFYARGTMRAGLVLNRAPAGKSLSLSLYRA